MAQLRRAMSVNARGLSLLPLIARSHGADTNATGMLRRQGLTTITTTAVSIPADTWVTHSLFTVILVVASYLAARAIVRKSQEAR